MHVRGFSTALTALTALTLVGGLAIGSLDPASATPAPSARRLLVTGYAEQGTPGSVVRREAHALAEVGVDGVTLTRSGADVKAPDRAALTLLRAAHTQGLRAELLVSNYSDAIGDFDTAEAGQLLHRPARVRAVATRLAAIVRSEGWDGITVDLESLRAGDGAGLVSLLRQLQRRLPAHAGVSIDVMASTSPADYRAAGYRLARIGRAVDVVALMAYDLHGPTWSQAGPIGPLSWQQRSLSALLTAVPARKVDLGVAGYGYSWPTTGSGRQYTDRAARALVARDGATARWDATAGEWTATLSDGTVLWWSDARSWRARVSLARSAGLHGLALWRLGSADQL